MACLCSCHKAHSLGVAAAVWTPRAGFLLHCSSLGVAWQHTHSYKENTPSHASSGPLGSALFNTYLHMCLPALCLPAAMHDLDPVFRSFSRSAKVCQLLQDLGYKRPLPMQSMYITKQVRATGGCGWVCSSGLALACPWLFAGHHGPDTGFRRWVLAKG
jgi:hypothetical protein